MAKIVCLSIITILISGLVYVCFVSDEVTTNSVPSQMYSYTTHNPIRIEGNSQFVPNATNGVVSGSGTVIDPYIIEGWDISATSFYGISIEKTTVNFTIRNCYIHDGKSTDKYGIYFYKIKNGTIHNNNVSNNKYGVIYSQSNDIKVFNNSLYLNGVGIELNTNANNSKIENNTILKCGYWGVTLNSATRNIVTFNIISQSTQYGIEVTGNSKYNLIHHNNLISNNGAGSTYNSAHIQTLDYTTSNSWNTSTEGNYWSDWTYYDNDTNGIIDGPYLIYGGTNARDYFPLTNPVSLAGAVPEFTIFPVTTMFSILILTGFFVYIRKRKF